MSLDAAAAAAAAGRFHIVSLHDYKGNQSGMHWKIYFPVHVELCCKDCKLENPFKTDKDLDNAGV